jgi:Methylase involved in ubiquinone/menaquinone biosynthesis
MSDVVEEPVSQRLASFQAIVEQGSQRLLKRVGVAPGMRVLELGCGTGAMTLWLARQVGPKGVVIALDRSTEALTSLSARAAEAGLDNIVCQQADLEQGVPALEEVDLVHGRFVLMHLRNSASLLCRLFDAMSPGALLALEEPSISSFRSQADRQLWQFCVDLYRRYCQVQHIDPNYGGRLLNHVSQAGFCVQDDALIFAALSYAQARRYMALSLMASGQRYVDAGLVERGVLDEQIAGLTAESHEARRTTHFHAVAQLTACR